MSAASQSEHSDEQSDPETSEKAATMVSRTITKETWWKHRPDDLELAIMAGKSFVRGEWDILQRHVPTFIALARNQRTRFLCDTVNKQIRAFWGRRFLKKELDKSGDLRAAWEKKRKAIATLFRNRAHKEKKLKLKGIDMRAPLSTVIAHLFRDRIQGATEGEGIGAFARALKTVRSTLTPEEWEEVMDLRGQWEDAGVPIEVQMKTAANGGKQHCTLFDDFRWKRMGMRCLTFECHRARDGRLVFAVHDNAARYKSPAGHTVRTMEEFDGEAMASFEQKYTEYCKYVEDLEGGEEPVVTAEDKESEACVVLEDSNGIPIVPQKNGRNALEMQSQIRGFLNKHWGVAGGGAGKKISSPWKELAATGAGLQCSFMDNQYLPPGFVLGDPSHLRGQKCYELLNYWRKREEEGQLAFRYSHVLISNGKRVEAFYPAPGKRPADPTPDESIECNPELVPQQARGTGKERKRGNRRTDKERTDSGSDEGDDNETAPRPKIDTRGLATTKTRTVPSRSDGDSEDSNVSSDEDTAVAERLLAAITLAKMIRAPKSAGLSSSLASTRATSETSEGVVPPKQATNLLQSAPPPGVSSIPTVEASEVNIAAVIGQAGQAKQVLEKEVDLSEDHDETELRGTSASLKPQGSVKSRKEPSTASKAPLPTPSATPGTSRASSVQSIAAEETPADISHAGRRRVATKPQDALIVEALARGKQQAALATSKSAKKKKKKPKGPSKKTALQPVAEEDPSSP